MTSNVVNVNSANIIQLGFLAYFDLSLNKLLIDITGQTLFKTGGAANVGIISFQITGPGGIVLLDANSTTPYIQPSAASTCILDLPSGYGRFGFYTIQASVSDGNIVYKTANISKNITKPVGYEIDSVPGNIHIEVNRDVPQLLVTEETKTAYQGLLPVSRTVSGVFSYPAGTLNPLLFTTTPFLVSGAGHVYTGRYTVNNKTICTYDINDGILVKIPYVVKGYEKVVEAVSSVSELMCCISEVKAVFDRNNFSVAGKAAYQKLQDITIPVYIAIIKEKSGVDNADEIAQIRKLLNCTCSSGSVLEPKPLAGAIV